VNADVSIYGNRNCNQRLMYTISRKPKL